MWPEERFAETVTILAVQHGAGVLLFGAGDQEHAQCADIAEMIRRSAPHIPVVNLAGTTSLTETAAVMDRCSIVLGNDSGLMHIAAARKRKVVVIFGPTVRELGFFPFGTQSKVIENTLLDCRPCTHIGLPFCPKGHFKCMNEIPTQRVVDAATHLLQG
jgi:ADP-heptose:LPS heptosyltransferase